jgi:hypothetical protein
VNLHGNLLKIHANMNYNYFCIMKQYQVGDLITLEGSGMFYPGIECIVITVSDNGRYPTKIKAITPNEKLGKKGFIEEDGEYYAVEWKWSPN